MRRTDDASLERQDSSSFSRAASKDGSSAVLNGRAVPGENGRKGTYSSALTTPSPLPPRKLISPISPVIKEFASTNASSSASVTATENMTVLQTGVLQVPHKEREVQTDIRHNGTQIFRSVHCVPDRDDDSNVVSKAVEHGRSRDKGWSPKANYKLPEREKTISGKREEYLKSFAVKSAESEASETANEVDDDIELFSTPESPHVRWDQRVRGGWESVDAVELVEEASSLSSTEREQRLQLKAEDGEGLKNGARGYLLESHIEDEGADVLAIIR